MEQCYDKTAKEGLVAKDRANTGLVTFAGFPDIRKHVADSHPDWKKWHLELSISPAVIEPPAPGRAAQGIARFKTNFPPIRKFIKDELHLDDWTIQLAIKNDDDGDDDGTAGRGSSTAARSRSGTKHKAVAKAPLKKNASRKKSAAKSARSSRKSRPLR